MSIDQFGIHISVLYVRYYGIIVMFGAFIAGYLASVEAVRRKHNPDLVWDGLIWALLGGIIGARLWHILTPPPSMVAQGFTTAYYFSHPLSMIAIWDGGVGLLGAVAGGVLGLFIFTRRAKLNFVEWIDIAAPAIPLGQAIGRWGNYVNQELYGQPTTLPWGLEIDTAHRVADFTNPVLRFQPTFLYESIGNLLICLALLYMARRLAGWLKKGDLFLFYLVLYPALRFAMEIIRLDSSEILGLNANQTVMAVILLLAVAGLLQNHRRVRRHEMKAQPAP
jgi:phosphatidylglycerol---prolipoprotein diacylglyceryl transferase